MGRDIQAVKISRQDRRKYREKVRRSLDILARMVRERLFEANSAQVGLEIELNLVDEHAAPSMRNADVLEAIADPVAWATELGRFNLEINVPPWQLDGDGLADLEQDVRGSLNAADAVARGTGAPRRSASGDRAEQDTHEGTLSSNEATGCLTSSFSGPRGGHAHRDRRRREAPHAWGSITPNAACTSVQLHVQVRPDAVANYWNAAGDHGRARRLKQLRAVPGRRQLRHETRITLFEQASDIRPDS